MKRASEPPSRIPLVTIGVPVFNEAAHVEAALDSLLEQDYANFEIVISDNGSTDRTGAICAAYADRENRIKYHRLPANVGAARNSNRIIELASGEYFLRASGHDKWTPDYVSACVAELIRRPGAVIAFGATEWIDEADRQYPRETGSTDTRGMSRLERFFTQMWGNMHPIMGVARTEAIRRALPFTNMPATDLAFLLELSLAGDFLQVPSVVWFRREVRGPEKYSHRMKRYSSKDVGLVESRIGGMFPYAKLLGRVPRVILRSRATLLEKAILLALVFPTMIGRYVGARKRQRSVYEHESTGTK